MDDENGVALLLQGGQESAEVELAQQPGGRQERVEVPPLPCNLPDGEPVLLQPQQSHNLSSGFCLVLHHNS